MTNWRLVVLSISLLALTCAAQDVPPPPKPPDTGPSLEETMKFTQEKLNSIGPVNFILYTHDNSNGNDWMNKQKVEVTDVRASASDCKITYHLRSTLNDKVQLDVDTYVLPKYLQQISVKSREQVEKEIETKAGHPEWTTRVDPPIFDLMMMYKDGASDFLVYDEDLANRLAKAIVHAVELCGGGKEQEPF